MGEEENVVETYGICSECKKLMTKEEELTSFREKRIHKRCMPSEEEIARRDKSYTP